eukprot:6211505-Pleurochrysis_carterae.AAC.2
MGFARVRLVARNFAWTRPQRPCASAFMCPRAQKGCVRCPRQAPTRRSWRAARTTCSTTHSRATSARTPRAKLHALRG